MSLKDKVFVDDVENGSTLLVTAQDSGDFYISTGRTGGKSGLIVRMDRRVACQLMAFLAKNTGTTHQ